MAAGAASLTTGSALTLSAADLTASTLTNLAAYLTERFTTSNNDDQENVIIWNVTNTDQTYIYHIDSIGAGGNTGIAATEITLIAVITRAAALTADNLLYS
jgi:hypothetical protein